MCKEPCDTCDCTKKPYGYRLLRLHAKGIPRERPQGLLLLDAEA
jgi:hypothetical protein